MIELRGAGYRYPSGRRVGPVDLEVKAGELVVLAGPSGSGKSTVLRLGAGLLQRHGAGDVLGTIRVDGADPAGLVARERARRLGFVGQDPDDGVVCATCFDEVAFAAVSAGLDAESARGWLDRVGLGGQDTRDPMELSGGQRQRLAVAAALSAGAKALFVDEPLAWLDPDGARRLVALLREVADTGVAVLVVEHRLELLTAVADRVTWMAPLPELQVPPDAAAPGDVVLRAEGLGYHWGVCSGTLEVRAGDRVALVGPNGAGKTTLLRMLAGELKPLTGRVDGPLGLLVPQNPDLGLFCRTVADELAYGPRERSTAADPGIAVAFGVDGLLDRPPQALSRGQRLRVAVAAAAACRPAVLCLDEPSAGQDRDQVERMFAALRGHTVLFATHDLDLVRRHATAIIHVEAGVARAVAEPPASIGAVPTPVPPAVPRREVDARVRLAGLVALGVAVVCLDRAVSLGLVAAAALAGALVHPKTRGWRGALLGTAVTLAWGTALSQALFYLGVPRTPWTFGPVTLWREGFLHGLVQSFRYVAVSAAGLAVALATPTDRLVAALAAVRVPFGLAMMASAALRFVPTVGTETLAVRRARARRGRPAWARPLRAWLVLEAELLVPVMARSVRRARALAETLEARGFHPTAPRPPERPLRLTERLTLTMGGVGMGMLVGLRLVYAAYGAELWYSPGLRGVYAFVRAWM